MRLQRVLHAPAPGTTRSYQMRGASAGLRLSQREHATLDLFMTGALESYSHMRSGRIVGFFPLDGREQNNWALALVEFTPFEARSAARMDAIILPRTDLDRIEWAVHRIALAWSGPPPALEGESVEEFDLDDRAFKVALPKGVPDPGAGAASFGYSVAARERTLIENESGIGAVPVLAALWEVLPPDVAQNRTFCTAPTFTWRPLDASVTQFDFVVGSSATPIEPGQFRVPFSPNGLELPEADQRPWHAPVNLIRRKLLARPEVRWSRRAEPYKPETDAAAAFQANLSRLEVKDDEAGLRLLCLAAQTGASLAQARELDGEHARALSLAVERNFTVLLRNPSTDSANALDVFAAEIAPALKDTPPDYALRAALERRVLLSLAGDTVARLAPALFADAALCKLATSFIREWNDDATALHAWLAATIDELHKARSDDILRLLAALVRLGGARAHTGLQAPDLKRGIDRLLDARAVRPLAAAVESWRRAEAAANPWPRACASMAASLSNARLDAALLTLPGNARLNLLQLYFAFSDFRSPAAAQGAQERTR